MGAPQPAPRSIVPSPPPPLRARAGPASGPRFHAPLTRFFLFVLMGFAAIYVLNPGWGMIEFIQDVYPVVGNLDEAGATALFLWAWREFFRRGERAD